MVADKLKVAGKIARALIDYKAMQPSFDAWFDEVADDSQGLYDMNTSAIELLSDYSAVVQEWAGSLKLNDIRK